MMARQTKKDSILALLDRCEKMLREDSRDTDALFTKGVVLAKMHRYEESLGCLEEIISMNPSYPGIHRLRATVLRLMSKEAGEPSIAPPSLEDMEDIENMESGRMDAESKSLDNGDKIPEIIEKILSLKAKTFTAENVHFALVAVLGCDYEREDVERALDILATPPLSILKRDGETYAFTTDSDTIMSRMELLEKVIGRGRATA